MSTMGDADDARARASAGTGPRLLALARDGNLEEARALLGSSSAGVTAADVDEDGLTALHFAADRGHVALAALLLARGAPLEARDSDGLTPLATAVLSEAEEMVRFLLLEHNADPDAPDGDGDTPRAHAEGNDAIEALLAKRDAAQAEAAASQKLKQEQQQQQQQKKKKKKQPQPQQQEKKQEPAKAKAKAGADTKKGLKKPKSSSKPKPKRAAAASPKAALIGDVD